MGVAQSSVATEAAAVGALLAGTATAYTVYKRVAGVDARNNDTDMRASEEKSGSSSASDATPSGGKKNKGKKRKGVNAATGSSKSEGDADAELDELLARAKAEAAAEHAAAEAHRAASKSLIPGAFDQDAASTGLSSEAEGREKKPRRKGKKATTPAAAAPSTVGRDGDSKEASLSSTHKLTDNSAQQPAPAQVSAPTEQAAPSKKQKKRKGAKTSDTTAAAADSASSSAKTTAARPVNAPSMQSSQALGMSVTMSDAPDDVSWTRVSTRKKSQQQSGREASQTDPELLTSDTNVTTSGVTDPENTEDEEGVQEPENRRTFAERMLPRPRKTGVEDMEDEPLQPSLARVVRVKPALGDKPAKGFSWGDYEEYAHAEEGESADGDSDDAWEEVKSKKKTKLDRSASGMTSSVDSLVPVQRSQTQEAPVTKRQRQNAERREAARLEKETQEQERLERLSKHKRELERTRIAEQYAASSGKKDVSGGMKASVEGGKLVWD